MENRYHCVTVASRNRLGSPATVLTAFVLLIVMFVTVGGCSSRVSVEKARPDAAFRQIAADYARHGDTAQASAALKKLDLANPEQLLLTLAELMIAEGRPAAEVDPLVALAEGLGLQTPKLIAYHAPAPLAPAPSSTLLPVQSTLPPTAAATSTTVVATPSATASATQPAATFTVVPPSVTPAPTPSAPTTPLQPHIVARDSVNLRGGPSLAYPVIGQLKAGQQVDILARNASGDWWKLAWTGSGQAWVAGTVVNVVGPIDTVSVAANIPVLPSPVPAPPATAVPAQPTAAPRPSVAYVVKSVRLRPIGQDAQSCTGGENSIWGYVVDRAGNRLDGVRVREVFTGIVNVTGDQGKGSGSVQWPIWRGGGGQLEVIDQSDNRISQVSRGMSADWPDFDLMKGAGYCNCKPHPDDATCKSELENKQFLFAVGHYTYEVVFERTY